MICSFVILFEMEQMAQTTSVVMSKMCTEGKGLSDCFVLVHIRYRYKQVFIILWTSYLNFLVDLKILQKWNLNIRSSLQVPQRSGTSVLCSMIVCGRLSRDRYGEDESRDLTKAADLARALTWAQVWLKQLL